MEDDKFGKIDVRGKLAMNYYFKQVVIRKDTGQILMYSDVNTNDMGNGLNRLKSRDRSTFINNIIPFEAFWYTQEGGAIHCTAGWESEICQRLMGYAMRTHNWKRYPALNSKPVLMDINTPSQSSNYYAVVQDVDKATTKKFNITTANLGKAYKQFDNLVKGNKIGVLVDTGARRGPVFRKTKSLMRSGYSAYSDIDKMLGKFTQDRFNLGKKVEKSIEGFEMTSKADWDKRETTYKANYLASVTKQRKQAKELTDLAARNADFANKYARPIVVSVFSIMNNTYYGRNSDW